MKCKNAVLIIVATALLQVLSLDACRRHRIDREKSLFLVPKHVVVGKSCGLSFLALCMVKS